MLTGVATPLSQEVLPFFKALADETRLAIVRQLALTDMRAGEVVQLLRAPQNAVSYHLKQLRALGLLRDHRSSSDARDIYYGLDLERLSALYAAAGSALHPGFAPALVEDPAAGTVEHPLRVLFLCTHNSARSQLAEGMIRYLGGGQVEAHSAGSQPCAVHPEALALLEGWGVDTAQHVSKSLERFREHTFDYVITVCDRVRESCPTFPGDPKQIHWSLPDPAAIEDAEARKRAFQQVFRELQVRIRYLLNLPHPATGQRFTITPLPLTRSE
jgi:protein-tyrosine-phosphatase